MSVRACSACLLTAVALGGCGSGSGEDLALLRVDEGGERQILLAGPDGGETETLTAGTEDAADEPQELTAGAWSPDGNSVAFEARLGPRGWRTGIYTAALGGGTSEALIEGDRLGAPVWTPDGESIIYSQRELGRAGVWTSGSIWIMDADGSNRRRMLNGSKGFVLNPSSVSPDGRTLLYTRMPVFGDPASSAVFSLPIEGGRPKRLATDAADAAYSNDGGRIAFASSRDRNGTYVSGDVELPANELYVSQADGTQPERLTETRDFSEASPTWMPGDQVIAYESREVGTEGFGFGVFRINDDGSCNLTVALDSSLEVDWLAPASNPTSDEVERLSC